MLLESDKRQTILATPLCKAELFKLNSRQTIVTITSYLPGKAQQVITDILALADELKKGTIEQVLGKSDEELGLDFLRRHLTGQ